LCHTLQVSGVDFLSILLIAIGLSADCFAVALSSSIARQNVSRFQALRVSLTFGLFQALMPVVGWLAGRTVVDFISSYDHWLAFGLLAFIGGKMIWESFREKDSDQKDKDISRGLLLLTLALATSIDALAVGLSFAFLEINIVLASLTIGVTALVISLVGFAVGRKAGSLLGKRAEIVGGVILIGIGVRILVEHLWM
jgi:putative Mn2+ efflux pump MntP